MLRAARCTPPVYHRQASSPAASGASAPLGASTSVTRRPNSSSMTTTSPRAIGLPLTSRSTGSPASRLSVTIDPGPSASPARMVIWVRPTSTASSTDTSCRRDSSSAVTGCGAAGAHSTGPAGGVSKGAESTVSAIGSFSLLNGEVREQNVFDLYIGLLLEHLEDLFLETLSPV